MGGGLCRLLTTAEVGIGSGAGCPSASNISVAYWQRGDQWQGESSPHIAELIELMHILSQKARGILVSSSKVQGLEAQALSPASQVPLPALRALHTLVSANPRGYHLGDPAQGSPPHRTCPWLTPYHTDYEFLLYPATLLHGINLLVNLESWLLLHSTGSQLWYFSSRGTLIYNNTQHLHSNLVYKALPCRLPMFYPHILIQPMRWTGGNKTFYYANFFFATSLKLFGLKDILT